MADARELVLVAGLMLASTSCAYGHADQANWLLLTASNNAPPALIKGLTQHQCKFAKARLTGQPVSPREKQEADVWRRKWEAENPTTSVEMINHLANAPGRDGYVLMAECFQ